MTLPDKLGPGDNCAYCGHDEHKHIGGNCVHGGLLQACGCYGYVAPTGANPYRHDQDPLEGDYHGGICPACEWEYQNVLREETGKPMAAPPVPTRAKAMRDLTACRSELASIAIMLQERGRLPDVGGDNFALVAGAVTALVLELEGMVFNLGDSLTVCRQVAEDHRDEIRRLRTALEDVADLVEFDAGVRPIIERALR